LLQLGKISHLQGDLEFNRFIAFCRTERAAENRRLVRAGGRYRTDGRNLPDAAGQKCPAGIDACAMRVQGKANEQKYWQNQKMELCVWAGPVGEHGIFLNR
jgi:hypothetical protein